MQSGFVKNRGTKDALTFIASLIYNKLYNNGYTWKLWYHR